MGNRRACPHHVAQADAALVASRKIAGTASSDVVTDDPDSLNAVVQTFERRTLQLLETARNEPAQLPQRSIEPVTESNVETVSHQVSAAKPMSIRDQLVEGEADGGVVRSNNGPGARTDDDVDRNTVSNELSQNAKMPGTT